VSERETVGVGLMGLGVIGAGVARTLSDKGAALALQVGCPVVLRRALDCDTAKRDSSGVSADVFTTDANLLLEDPTIDIVVEVIGGDTVAREYIKRALAASKHVVTANKELIAKHGAELRSLADREGVGLSYEASVGGGIPIIGPLRQDLVANRISRIRAIINGTTNYIVTRMASEGAEFEAVLAQARALGYAEADPTNDIEGIDAAYKIAILATIAFNTEVHPDDVYREGISRLTARDFRYAKELGYAIRLLAIASDEDGSVQARVHPTFVPEGLLLAKVDGVFNAIEIHGDLAGDLVFYGQGAGSRATSSAIVADVVRTAQAIRLDVPLKCQSHPSRAKSVAPVSTIVTRYYMRLTIEDMPGVLGQIATILGDHGIGIASVIQKEADEASRTAEIVIMTHPALEASFRKAMDAAEALLVVRDIGNLIRVLD
jgi:homoserine dehydrogenase